MSRKIAIWLDGDRTSSLPLPNRGLDFADGVFETFLLHDGEPLFSEYHLDRLRLGLQVLGISYCPDTVQSQLGKAASEAGKDLRWAILRLCVLRGPGPRGYAPSRSSSPQILIYVDVMERDCAKMERRAELGIAGIRLSTQPLLARIKHLNRLEQVIAAAQSQREGFDESILLDQAGYLTSVIAGNIFVVCDGELLTPLLIECGVAGTRRRLILEKWGPSIGLKVRETRLSLLELYSAEEVFYSNSLLTVRPIARIGDHEWQRHDVCEALFQRFLVELT